MTEQPAQAQPTDPRRWLEELQASHREVKEWHEDGQSVVDRYVLKPEEGKPGGDPRLNLFTVNVDTTLALLYGNLPKVSVERRYADAADDDARVAGELLQRLLNADIERSGDTYAAALKNAIKDRMLPGLGQVRVRYVAEFEDVPEQPAMVSMGAEIAPAVPAHKRKTYECVHTDFVHWKDFRWSPARTWDEVRWVAFKNELSRETFRAQFGKEKESQVSFTTPTPKDKQEDGRKDPWERVCVWEVWDRTSKSVLWFVESGAVLLKVEADTYGLTRFFPCPEPMLGLTTTDKVVPLPDYFVAKHLYEEVDKLSARIDMLTDAVRVAGAYDGTQEQLKRMVEEKGFNKLYPVDNWAAFAEKGGIPGGVSWMPLGEIVTALQVLVGQRQEAKAQLYEITGHSDIMRGHGSEGGVTASEQILKARFGSVRLQKLQEDFARFASEAQSLKAELIANKYDVESILKYSNAEFMQDAQRAPQAAALLKERHTQYRVEVKPEAVSMQDFAQLRQERTELLGAVVQFIQSMAPMVQMLPSSMPFLLRMLQWFVAGLRGSKQIEGVLDDAIQAAEQAAKQPQQPQQDPKVASEMMKAANQRQKTQDETQARLIEIQAEISAREREEQMQREQNVMEHAQKQVISNALKPPPTKNGGVPK